MARVAIAGFGGRGSKQLEYLLTLPERWEVAAVADRSPIAYGALQAQFYDRRIPFLGRAAELAAYEPDVVVVSSTAAGHVPIALELLGAGYGGAILIEKPIASSVAAARRLREAAGGARIAVGFQRRCSTMYAEAQRAVAGGALGAVRRIEYSAPAQTQISMNGSHQVDLATWFAGSSPVRVTATLAAESDAGRRGAYFFDPAGTAEVEYANGVTLRLDTTGNGTPGFTLEAERGRLHVGPDEQELTLGDRTIPADSPEQTLHWFERSLQALVDGETPCTVDEALADLEVVAGAFVSSARGGVPVELPLSAEEAELELRVA